MSEPMRISPEEVRQKMISGTALLVCSYSDEERFRRHHLEGAISLDDFEARVADLSMEQEIIFYCA